MLNEVYNFYHCNFIAIFVKKKKKGALGKMISAQIFVALLKLKGKLFCSVICMFNRYGGGRMSGAPGAGVHKRLRKNISSKK